MIVIRSDKRPKAPSRKEETMIEFKRRDILQAAAAAAAFGLLGTGAAYAQEVKWSTGIEKPKIKVPPNACDCHHHIYGSQYKVDPKATLRPGDATVDDYRALQKRIGTTRDVIVQPSTYGTMNEPTLDALTAIGPTARAVVVVDTTVTDAELKRMHGLGARGVRFNLAQAGATTPEMLDPIAKRITALGWHIQVNATADKIMEIMPILETLPCPIVFDHLAHIPEPDGIKHPLFGKVLALIDKGKTWVKLSGAYADTKVGPPTYADSSAVARAYVQKAPERLVWGSDWPHPSERETKPDDAILIDLMLDWAPDEAVRNRIFVDNAATLYDFPKT
jgi:predicted TIM-barrel fold metal-dependent hydrolase